jgi:hypothetical protein
VRRRRLRTLGCRCVAQLRCAARTGGWQPRACTARRHGCTARTSAQPACALHAALAGTRRCTLTASGARCVTRRVARIDTTACNTREGTQYTHTETRSVALSALAVKVAQQKCFQRRQERTHLGALDAARRPYTVPAAQGRCHSAIGRRRAPAAATSARLHCPPQSASVMQRSRARNKAPLHSHGTRSAAAQQRSASQEFGAGRAQNRLQAATPRVTARALFARQTQPARHSTRLARRKRVKRRTVCAPFCRTARSGACAGLSAQARPVSSRTTSAADNGTTCTTEQALAAFDSAARRASTHSSRRRCGVLGSQTPARRRDAQPRNEEVCVLRIFWIGLSVELTGRASAPVAAQQP